MDDENDNPMFDLLAHSLEGNALGVKDAVDNMMAAKTLDAIQSMKIDVAQSIYGTYARDEDGPNDPEDADFEIPEDDDYVMDDEELEDLFAEIEDLSSEEDSIEQEDGDETDV